MFLFKLKPESNDLLLLISLFLLKFLFMRLISSILFLSVLAIISCNTANNKTEQAETNIIHSPEDSAIKKAVADAYACISFKQGEQLNFEHIKDCFIPRAQLINFRSDSMDILSIGQFVEMYKGLITSNAVSSFYEEEIKGTTEQFGRIAQRISSYKTYINTMDSVAERGVNSFQLVKTAQGWKVSTIIWDVETEKLKIPDYYLKQ